MNRERGGSRSGRISAGLVPAGQGAPTVAPDAIRVFVSYARRDLAVVDGLTATLEKFVSKDGLSFQLLIDRRDLPYGEEWKQELLALIEQCDAVVFVVSPSSISSPWCAWELEQVQRLSKRLVPLVLGEVQPDQLPPAIADRQMLPLAGWSGDGAAYAQSLALLAKTLLTDNRWIKEHSRLGDRARQWAARDRDPSLLLRGAALRDAEQWMDRRPPGAPPPSEDMLELVLGSRRAATRRQRGAIAGALTVAVVALALAGVALWQREVALENEVRAAAERTLAQQNESRLLADLSAQELKKGDSETSALLALEGLPPIEDPTSRPMITEARQALYDAIWNRRLIGVYRSRPVEDLLAPLLPIAKDMMADQEKFAALKDKPLSDLRERFAGAVDVVADSYIRAAALSADGQRVAADFASGRIMVWDVATGAVIGDQVCHPPPPDAALNELPNAKSHAFFLSDGTLIVARLTAPEFKTLKASVCTWRADGPLRSLVEVDGAVSLRDASGVEVQRFAKPPGSELDTRLSQSLPRLLLAISGEPDVHLIDLTGGLEPVTFPAFRSQNRFDGLTMWNVNGGVACSTHGIFDLAQGRTIHRFDFKDVSFSNCAALGVTGRVLTFTLAEQVSGGRGVLAGRVSLWDAGTGALVQAHTFSTPKAPDLTAGSPGDDPLGASDVLDREEILASIRPKVSRDGRRFLIETPDRMFRVFDAKDGRPVWTSLADNLESRAVAVALLEQLPAGDRPLEETMEHAEGILTKVGIADGKTPSFVGFHAQRPHMILARPDAGGGTALEVWDLEPERLVQRIGTVRAAKVTVMLSNDTGAARLLVTETPTDASFGSVTLAWVFAETPQALDDGFGLNLRLGSAARWTKVLSLDSLLSLPTAVRLAERADAVLTVQEMGTRVAVWSTAGHGGGVRVIAAHDPQPSADIEIPQMAYDATGAVLAAKVSYSARFFDVAAPVPTARAHPVFKRETPGVTGSSTADDIFASTRIEEPDGPTFASGRLDAREGVVRPVPLPDGVQRFVLAGDRALVRELGQTRVIRLDTQATVAVLATGRDPAKADSFDPDDVEIARVNEVTALSRGGRRAVADDVHGRPTVFDAVSGQALGALTIPPLEGLDLVQAEMSRRAAPLLGTLAAVAFAPDETTIAGAMTIGNDAFVWDATTGAVKLRLKGQSDGVQSVAYSADGRLIAVGAKGGRVRLYDAASGALHLVLTGHADAVTALAFRPDGQELASASEDGTIRLWRLFPSDRDAIAFSRQTTPHCLGPGQRARHSLSSQSPAWCAALKKPPQYVLETLGTSFGLDGGDLEQMLRRAETR